MEMHRYSNNNNNNDDDDTTTNNLLNPSEETEGTEKFTTPLQPHTILLKDGETIATMYPIPAMPELLPMGLLAFLLDEFNMEVEKGDCFPYYETLSLEEFKKVWFHEDGHICVMVLGEVPELDYSEVNDLPDIDNNYSTDITTMRHSSQYRKRKERRNLNLKIPWEKQCLGIYSLQPAYPGRSAHVVTGLFLVNAGIRGKGIGRTLVECFMEWAKKLGFTSSYFPLIYGTNVGIRRIFESLNFRRVGKLPESGILKGFDVPIDSFIYGKEFTHITKSIDLLRDPQKSSDIAKYERLRFYLEHGDYPPNCDRNEKARLRVNAKTHYLFNGKLMTKGKEVIYDPENQRQIALDMHMVEHHGINRITSKIVERYHWKGIKSTVAEVIAQCPRCKLRHQDGTGVIIEPKKSVPQAHMLPRQANADTVDHSIQLSQMAAAVVRRLQDDTAEGEEVDPTPPDGTDMRGTSVGQHSHEESSVELHDHLVDPQQMNAFNRFVEAEYSRKKRRLNDSKRSSSSSVNDTPGTVPMLDTSDEQMIKDAMQSLEDNVLAAVALAQKEEEHGKSRRSA